MEIFDRLGVPAGPVAFAEEMATDRQGLGNGLIVDLDHALSGPQQMLGPMLKFSGSPLEAQGASRPLGRDSEALVAEAGFDAEAIAALRADGVIE